MKSCFLVCLAMVVMVSATGLASPKPGAEELSPFAEATRIGEPNKRSFYLFSTSVGNYTITHNGMGEVFVRGRRKVFHVKVGARARLERLYFFEYEGDVLLLYEAGPSGYLLRLDQKTKKVKRVTAIPEDFTPPLIKDRNAVFSDGTVVPLD